MDQSLLKVAVLVVSDTASKNPEEEKTRPVIEEVLETEKRWKIVKFKIVGDDVSSIQSVVAEWADQSVAELILTCGGTGFTIRDSTPEAVLPLLQKQAPGLVTGMLSKSLTITPFAMMARPVAGVRNKSVIVTLPGSPKGAKENLEAIIKVLPHACLQVSMENSRDLHEKMGAPPPVSDRSDPSGVQAQKKQRTGESLHNSNIPPSLIPSVADRPRMSQWPRLSLAEARKVILENIPKPLIKECKVDCSLIGKVLAKDVNALESVPSCTVSLMDGYAVIAEPYLDQESLGWEAEVRGSLHAHSTTSYELVAGEAVRVTTGAPVPKNATCVIPVEDTEIIARTEDGKEETKIRFNNRRMSHGMNIRVKGSDCQEGQLLMKAGEVLLRPGHIGTLLSAGVQTVPVFEMPTVGIMSTGSELVNPSEPAPLRPGDVRDTNGTCLKEMCRQFGFKTVDYGICADSAEGLESHLRWALSGCHVLITSGGASMGETDLIKPVIEKRLGGTIHFGRMSIKPGMPTIFSTVDFLRGISLSRKQVIFSLPGNPASAMAVFYTVVLPSIRAMSGYSPEDQGLPQLDVELEDEQSWIQDKERTEFHRVSIYWCTKDKVMKARSTGGQRSSRIQSFADANGLAIVPPLSEGQICGDQKGEKKVLKAILTDSLARAPSSSNPPVNQ